MKVAAIVTLAFGGTTLSAVDQFNFEWILASFDCLGEEFGILVDDVHTIPNALVLSAITVVFADF